jgi:hypothetical protein
MKDTAANTGSSGRAGLRPPEGMRLKSRLPLRQVSPSPPAAEPNRWAATLVAS